MLIQIKPPELLERTYMALPQVAGQTALTVQSNNSYTANDFIIIGVLGSETAEIRKIASLTGGNTITISSSLTYPHGSNTPISKVLYDKIKVYSSATETGTFAEISGSPFVINAEATTTVINDSSGSSTTWYKTSYSNSYSSVESAKSDAMQGSGAKRGSARQLINQVRRNMTLKNDNQINDDDIISWFNEALDDIQDKVNWPKSEATQNMSSTASTAIYDMPSDVVLIKSIKIISGSIDYYPTYKTVDEFNALRTQTTLTGTVPEYYTIWDDKIEFWPAFSATGTNNIVLSYYQTLTYLDSDNDVPNITHPEILVFYACMMVGMKRGDQNATALWARLYENRVTNMVKTSSSKQSAKFNKTRRPGIQEPLDPNRFNVISVGWE